MKSNILLLFLFLSIISCQRKDENSLIAIQLFDQYSDLELNAIQDSIKSTFGCEAIILPEIPVPDNYITRIKSYRYRADSILNYLAKIQADSVQITLGLTKTDIAITKKDKKTGQIKKPISTYRDWAIFGLGQVNGTACVVSSYRLKKGVNSKGYVKRLTRICNHEIGHVFGLPHCQNKKCLMNDANETIQTIDKSSGQLCQSCKSKIF